MPRAALGCLNDSALALFLRFPSPQPAPEPCFAGGAAASTRALLAGRGCLAPRRAGVGRSTGPAGSLRSRRQSPAAAGPLPLRGSKAARPGRRSAAQRARSGRRCLQGCPSCFLPGESDARMQQRAKRLLTAGWCFCSEVGHRDSLKLTSGQCLLKIT